MSRVRPIPLYLALCAAVPGATPVTMVGVTVDRNGTAVATADVARRSGAPRLIKLGVKVDL